MGYYYSTYFAYGVHVPQEQWRTSYVVEEGKRIDGVIAGLGLRTNGTKVAHLSAGPYDADMFFLIIDIDGLDSAVAPGTGCPEPGGPSFLELQALIATLAQFRVVGVDVMEVLPAVDCHDITAIAAAKLVRECALAFAARPLRHSPQLGRGSGGADGPTPAPERP